jgi:iron complex outermembrane receptor protein
VINERGSGAVLSAVASSDVNAPLFPQLQANLALQQQLGIRTVLGNYLPHYAVRKSQGWINTTNWVLNENLTLKNIYSQRDSTGGQSYDLDASNLTLLHVSNPPAADRSRTRTEEAQAQFALGPISGVVGYYYEKAKRPRALGFEIEQTALGSPLLFFGPVSTIQVIGQGEDTTNAFFGQADWKITDQLTLTGGARRTKAKVSSGPQETRLVLASGPMALGPPTPVAISTFKSTTWNVAANYKITPDLNVYGTVRKGYKPGGFNGTAQLASDRPYQPESVTDYEVGVKGQQAFGDIQTRFAVDVFYDDYSNVQRFVNLPTVPAQTIVRNAAAGKIKGVDLDLTMVASEMFQVGLNYTYLKASYDRYVDPGLGDLSDSRFPNTPKHQLTVTPKVFVPVPDRFGSLSALASIYYQSALATDPANVPNGNPRTNLSALGANVKGFARVDLRADLRNINDSHVSVAAYVQNAFDKKYVVGTNNQLNAATGTVAYLYSAPRLFGFELRYDFGS